jgi:glycosyltransferase involved in cell wall biosynthesis
VRIGIDARELCGRSTGVGRYLGRLLAEWRHDPRAQSHQFVLYGPEAIPGRWLAPHITEHVTPGRGNWWWEQITLPRALATDRLDVFFAPAYSGPRVACPLVVTVHDVSFFAHPEWFRTPEGLKRRWLTRRSATQAHTVITVSEFSRREIVDHLGLSGSNVQVILHGANAPTAGASGPEASLRAAARATVPLVLYVGSVFNRRHVPDLIRAFAPLAAESPDPVLEIVGDNRSFPLEDLRVIIERAGLQDRVRWHRYLGDDELASLYKKAHAFAFLSEYEGFGLTPLEALAAGVPAVLLDTAVARETCGAAALYSPIGSVRGVTDALRRLLYDSGARAALLEARPAVLARYDWATTASRTLDVLEGTAHG